MLKRILFWLAILSIGAVGLSEDLTVWSSAQDIYYHTDPDCSHPNWDRYALSQGAAENFEKLPCPVCVTGAAEDTPEPSPSPEATEADTQPPAQEEVDITCVERGGTWVFCFPAASLDGLLATGDLDIVEELPTGARALMDIVGEQLTDDIAATIAVPTGSGLVMSLRVAGDRAYALIRPEKDYKARRPFKWRAVRILTDIFNADAYSIGGVSEEMSFVPPKKLEKPRSVFEADFDEMDIAVFSWSDGYVAVLHKDNPEDNLTGTIQIGDSAIAAAGYRSKKKGVFCVPLTEAELRQLEDGAVPGFTPDAANDADGWEETDDGDFRPIVTLGPDVFDS